MFVSFSSRAIAIFCSRTISWNEVPCAASVVPLSEPVSSGGKSPFGMTCQSPAVSTRISTENATMTGRCRITHARLRS